MSHYDDERRLAMNENHTPIATISQHEVSALSAILQFYERHLWNSTAPSAKRSQRSIELTAVIVKPALLPHGDTATLTKDDIDYVQGSLRTFIAEVKRKIPQSESRIDLLTSCQQLQILFAGLIPSQTEKIGQKPAR
jgi:hypothetical protein